MCVVENQNLESSRFVGQTLLSFALLVIRLVVWFCTVWHLHGDGVSIVLLDQNRGCIRFNCNERSRNALIIHGRLLVGRQLRGKPHQTRVDPTVVVTVHVPP